MPMHWRRDQEKEMLPAVSHFVRKMTRALCIAGVLSAVLAWASVGGSISGTVKDPSGSVVLNADVTVRETGTGVSFKTHTDSMGHYTFPVLPVGHYELNV